MHEELIETAQKADAANARVIELEGESVALKKKLAELTAQLAEAQRRLAAQTTHATPPPDNPATPQRRTTTHANDWTRDPR